MGSVLIAWELGGGLGHLMQVSALARALASRGHLVWAALRHLSAAASELLAPARVRLLQSPQRAPGPLPFPRPVFFAHVMGNAGFGEERELFALASAWRALMEFVRPDAVVFDHAPVALLACRTLPFPVSRLLLGSGFCCPPDAAGGPLATIRRDVNVSTERAGGQEPRMFARANRLLEYFGGPPLERLGQLYSDIDDTFLMTFEELEQYASRPNAQYWGPVLPEGGEAPAWPGGEADEDRGRRIEDSAGAGPPSSILHPRLRPGESSLTSSALTGWTRCRRRCASRDTARCCTSMGWATPSGGGWNRRTCA